jgi:hypothetical protein
MSHSRKMLIAGFLLAVSLMSLVLAGCVNRAQCGQICERYRDCFDSDYDVGDCVDDCVDESRDDDEYKEQVDVCETCIQDRSCSESFGCTAQCAGIVP